MIIKFNKHKVSLSFYLFCAIFAPPIIPNINFIYLVAAFSILVICTGYMTYASKILHDPYVRRLNRLMIIVMLYYIAIMAMCIFRGTIIESANYLMVLYRFVTILVFIEPICMYTLVYCRKHFLKVEDFIECLIYSTLYEFFFCLLTIVSPAAKTFFTNLMINNTGYYYNIQAWTIRTRFWGFAASMTDYFGFAVGIIAGICLHYLFSKEKKFFIFIPIMLLMMVLNAITGLLIFAISVLVYFIEHLHKKRIRRNNFAMVVLVIFLTPFALYLFTKVAPSGISKVVDNFYEIFDKSKVHASNTSVRQLFSDRFWNLPDSILKMIFGTGHSLLSTKYFACSDVGYINDIWSFGIVGMILYMAAYLGFAFQIRKNTMFKTPITFIIFSVAVFNIKGISVGCNAGNVVILLTLFAVYFLPGEGNGGYDRIDEVNREARTKRNI